jgi:hypothetical protein
MTRTKTKPPMRKPLFDADEVISFAAAGEAGPATGTVAEADGRQRKTAKKTGEALTTLTLMVSPEAFARLRAAADRKGKTIDQVVEKLLVKHLDKH